MKIESDLNENLFEICKYGYARTLTLLCLVPTFILGLLAISMPVITIFSFFGFLCLSITFFYFSGGVWIVIDRQRKLIVLRKGRLMNCQKIEKIVGLLENQWELGRDLEGGCMGMYLNENVNESSIYLQNEFDREMKIKFKRWINKIKST